MACSFSGFTASRNEHTEERTSKRQGPLEATLGVTHFADKACREAVSVNAYGASEPWACTLPAGLVQSLKDPKSGSRSCDRPPPSLGRRSCVLLWLPALPLQTCRGPGLQPPTLLVACCDQVAPPAHTEPFQPHRAPVLDQPPP